MRAPVEREAGKGGSRAEGPRMISQHPQRKGPGVLRPRANPPLEEVEETMGGPQSDPWRTVYHSDAAPQYPPLEGRGAAATESAPRRDRARKGRTHHGMHHRLDAGHRNGLRRRDRQRPS